MKNITQLFAAFVAMLAGMVALAGAASAQTVQPGVAEIEGGFASVTTLLTGTLIPALIGLVVVGLVVAVGLKYLRRGATKA